jgi:tRNA dimethylallyltransferase
MTPTRRRGPFLALVGPTATGKTEAAAVLAERLGAEIVSVDSMVVYRGMDVGTAKPTHEQRARVPHHLIDVAEPSEPFSVARYQRLAAEAIDGIRGRGNRVLLVGGTGLYFRAIVDDLTFPTTEPAVRAQLETEALALGAGRLHERLAALDPTAAAKIEPGNARRTVRALEVAAITGHPFSSFAGAWERYPVDRVRAAGVEPSRHALARRIAARVDGMLEAGLVEEVRGLLDRGLGGWLTAAQAIGYAEVARHLAGELSLDEATALIERRTRALARRQLAWFRRDPRIRWFPAGSGGAADVVEEVSAHLERA